MLPFQCSLDNGQVRLVPTTARPLQISGARQERVVLACAKGGSVHCRTMIAHKFSVQCGGELVPWVRIAEAIGGRRTSRVWRTGEQLNIAIVEDPKAAGAPARAPCDAPAKEEGLPGAAVLEKIAHRPCDESAAREMRFVLPAGFAPVSHFGARIVRADLMAGMAAASDRAGRNVEVAAAPAPSRSAADRTHLLERTVLSEPLPDINSPQHQPALAGAPAGATGTLHDPSADEPSRGPAAAGNSVILSEHSQTRSPAQAQASAQRLAWRATVKHADAAGGLSAGAVGGTGLPAVAATTSRDLTVWLLLTSLFVVSGWTIWMRPHLVTGLGRRIGGNGERTGAFLGAISRRGAQVVQSVQARAAGLTLKQGQSAAGDGAHYPAAGLDAVCARVGGIVQGLPGDLPLRGVLDDEMRRVRQRLSVVKAAGGTADAQVPAPAFRVLMRDLERIGRIAESARDSMASGRARGGASPLGSGRMPRTPHEAFELLGLNPNVSAATVKKCVDALRMSWHPDLAHDAADLAQREERMKQINAAAELIADRMQNAG